MGQNLHQWNKIMYYKFFHKQQKIDTNPEESLKIAKYRNKNL